MDSSQTPAPDQPVIPPNAQATPPEENPPQSGSWLTQHGPSVLFMAAVVAVIVIYLDVWAVFKVAVGLGLVIFIHELGHFLAAKWCDVHVKTFSIGFGPALPGCSFKHGETTYKIALVPLGGYVAMVGEGETGGEADEEEAEKDPRSFRNKSVYQRMVIISAGVIMNIFLAAVCFVVAYTNGVQEPPATIGSVSSGSAAWRAGLHTGDHIVQIDDKVNPVFDDILPIIMSTKEGEEVRLVIENPRRFEGTREFRVSPTLELTGLYPQLGIGAVDGLKLMDFDREGFRPYRPNSPAAETEVPFQLGDRVIAMTDPDNPGEITPVSDHVEYLDRLARLAGEPVTLRVARADGGEEADIRVGPAYHRRLGLRMQMGAITAVREGSPAAEAGVQPLPVGDNKEPKYGDKLVQIEVKDGDRTVRWVSAIDEAAGEEIIQRLIDPVRLPFELEQWAARQTGDRELVVTVSRSSEHEVEGETVKLPMTWQKGQEDHGLSVNSGNASVAISGLGLAYRILTVVDAVEEDSPATRAGDFSFQKGDVIKEARWTVRNEDGEFEPGKWSELEAEQWAYFFYWLQYVDSPKVDFKVQRGEDELIEVTLTAEDDADWPAVERGLLFRPEFSIQKADGMVEALGMGLHRTVRTIKRIYLNLTSMLFGRVSAKTLSGPITIASFSYKIAEYDLWAFILFIGMISVNLAVVNFLPIPVLDGGHMTFLLYEMVRGKPAPERVQITAMFIGLALILALMAFVIFLDISRLWE